MKRIFLYACALVVLGLALAVVAASCVPNGPGSPYISTVDPQMAALGTSMAASTATVSLPEVTGRVTVTVVPTLAPSFTPEPDLIYHYLILGVDDGPGRPKPAPGGSGNKTDVMLLVTVRTNVEPFHITITQFPRNLWVPEYPANLLFEVYRQYGFDGTEEYFRKVFGIELDGIAAVDMTTFVEYVSSIGGVTIEGENYDGAELLAWLRDNDNNWKQGVYDAGMRQHRAFIAILDTLWHKFGQMDPRLVWRAFDRVETNVDLLDFINISTIGIVGAIDGMAIDYERLASPTIQRDEVPIPPYRAEVATTDLREWMAGIVGR